MAEDAEVERPEKALMWTILVVAMENGHGRNWVQVAASGPPG